MASTKKLPVNQCRTVQQRELSSITCYSDGSWVRNWEGGIGVVFKEGDILKWYTSRAVQACCSMQAEAQALKLGIQQATKLGISQCVFFTDYKELQEIVTKLQPPTQMDWRACKEVLEVWKLLMDNKEYQCLFVNRGHNEMADYLAKKGRKEKWNVSGFTFPLFLE